MSIKEDILPPSLDIIIVNWNAGEHLARCVQSILECSTSSFNLANIVVVDNASIDQSVEAIEHLHPQLTIVRAKRNLGFAAACNLGASQSDSEYLLFLNPDVVLRHDSLDTPMRFFRSPEAAGSAVCSIQLRNHEGNIHRSCARMPRPVNFFWHSSGLSRLSSRLFPDVTLNEWDHQESRPVSHVVGAFYMMRRAAFISANGFDERFFVYLEDLDLSVRLHELGWRIFYLVSTNAIHIGGGTSVNAKGVALFYSLRSRLLYARKHFSPVSAMLVFISTLFIEPCSRVIHALLRRRPQAIVESAKAYRYLFHSILSCWFHPDDRSRVAYAVSE